MSGGEWRVLPAVAQSTASGLSGAAAALSRLVWRDEKSVHLFGPVMYKYVAGGGVGCIHINTTGNWAIFAPQPRAILELGPLVSYGPISYDALRIGLAAGRDLVSGGPMRLTAETSSAVAGSWAAYVPGAYVGAALGSMVPVAGATVGGVGGGLIASYGGGVAGRRIAQSVLPPEPEKPQEEFEWISTEEAQRAISAEASAEEQEADTFVVLLPNRSVEPS